MDPMAEAEIRDDNLSVGPSPVQRVALVFSSPSRAFTGAGLAKSWWLPFLLIVLFGFGYSAIIGSRVGWDTVTRNNMADSPKRQAQMQQLSAEQQQTQMALAARITRVISFAAPLVAPLLLGAIIAGILLGTLNFGFGGHARYAALFAVYMFSALPQLIKTIVASAMLFAGVGTDTFLINNPVGSNPAYYLQGGGMSHGVLALLSWFDVFLIWQIVVLILGCAVVSRLSRGKAAAAVCIWVVLLMLGTSALAAVS